MDCAVTNESRASWAADRPSWRSSTVRAVYCNAVMPAAAYELLEAGPDRQLELLDEVQQGWAGAHGARLAD
nr:hypothetical protein GCM10020092_037680 [Actinoplanes digitatis]